MRDTATVPDGPCSPAMRDHTNVDVGPYLRALEGLVGFELGEPDGDVFEFVIDDEQPVSFRLDALGGAAEIVTLISGASSQLAPPLLARLLEFNFPNNSMAGAMVCVTPGGHDLQLVNHFTLSSISPQALAETALAQGMAAITVAKWLIEQQAETDKMEE
jgi:hypothetical protein